MITNHSLELFLKARSYAVVGVSASKAKFGTTIYRTLKQRGLTVYPVHPKLESLDGDRCYPGLGEIPEKPDAVVIVVKPEKAAAVVEDAAAAGISRVWFQQGADFSEAARMATQRGMNVVTGKCILMYAGPVTGLHRVHQWIARLIGRY